jgi:hypothetical protein
MMTIVVVIVVVLVVIIIIGDVDDVTIHDMLSLPLVGPVLY